MIKEMFLDLRGNNQRAIQNTFWSENDSSDKLALFFTGFRYPSEAPLFHFTKLFLLAEGWSILTLDYRYNEIGSFMSLPEEAQNEYFFREIDLIQEQLEEKLHYNKYCFIAKSLGTSVLYKMLKNNLSFPSEVSCHFIWLTPGEFSIEIFQWILENSPSSLLAIGDRDPYFDQKYLDKVKEKLGEKCLIVPGSGHLFEVKHDLEKTMNNTLNVIRFLQTNLAGL